MTKYQKKELETVKERWVESKTLCDFCNRDVDSLDDGNMTEIDIEAKIGSHYGDDGDARDGYRIDVCSECFYSKVKPAIESLGVKWHEYNPEDTYPGRYGHYFETE